MKDNGDSKTHQKDGERFYRVRTAMDFTQEKMANQLGCSVRTVRHYEHADSEVPLHLRRRIGEMSGLDVNPLDPEEDPYLITAQYRETQRAKEPPPAMEQSPGQNTLLAGIKRFRASSLQRQKDQQTPIRRAFESTVITAHLTASLILTIELFQRSNGGWPAHQGYHDLLLLGSVSTAICLLLPTLMTIPWGIKSVKT